MNFSRLVLRNVSYYWRTNLADMAGVAVAVAVLSGALLVGQSVQGSLRRLVYERIGATEYLVTADHFFREDLAGTLIPAAGAGDSMHSCPIIQLQGILSHATTGSRVLDVNVYGVDERFWRFHSLADRKALPYRAAVVGSALAEKLGAGPGDALLLRIETQQGIPREWLFGRRDEVGRTLRLVCDGILPADGLGEFALRPGQGSVHSVFVPLKRLQRDLSQPAAVNAILLSSRYGDGEVEAIHDALKKAAALKDLGIELRPLPSLAGVSLLLQRRHRGIRQAAQQGQEVLHPKVIAFSGRRPHEYTQNGVVRKADITVEVVIQYNDSYNAQVMPYTNTVHNPDGGSHQAGFRAAVTRAVNQYARQNNLLKEKDPQVTGDDLTEGLVAVISIKHPDPKFNNQPKEKLLSPAGRRHRQFDHL